MILIIHSTIHDIKRTEYIHTSMQKFISTYQADGINTGTIMFYGLTIFRGKVMTMMLRTSEL